MYKLFYHLEDNDGLFSAAIIYNYLIHELNVNKKDISAEGVTYNILNEKYSNPSDIIDLHQKYDTLIMTDISFNNIGCMKELYRIYNNNFIWIDHHLPIIQSSVQNKFDKLPGIRDYSRSAILNAYKYCYDQFDEKYLNKTCPELFRILSAWDSFSYKREGYELDYVRNVNKGTTFNYNLNFKNIVELVYRIIYKEKKINLNSLYNLGDVLNCYDDEQSYKQLQEYGDAEWTVDEKRSAVMIMFQGPTNSLMFKHAPTIFNKEIKNGIVFKYVNNNWTVSLYNLDTEDDFNCGKYLKKHYKGGGHIGAGGCTIDMKQFNKIFKTKAL